MSDTPSDIPSDGPALWNTVEGLVRWLDRESALPPEQERLLRILKLSEEAGEVAQAVIGATGQNPRKGHSHTWDDVHSELCDVILTAMVALATLTPDARQVFAGHVERVAGRVRPATRSSTDDGSHPSAHGRSAVR
ncbi:MazG-like family protein [Streptomyces halobius]|uniref:MazG-like family protein n=1 Tax=Streptomyces halobius TaxID=2879846 RepID=A0ABY4MA79_9ACTN|nr:MazG-like family protein [Streptomyces halobius]UQA94605.1 MazG-like family protein [Streptomyces halobius]